VKDIKGKNSVVSRIVFYIQLVFISLVASYDSYLAVKLRDTLYSAELNPLGRMLIRMDNGDVALFMGAKMLGTIFVLGILLFLYYYKESWAGAHKVRNWALPVTAFVTLVQVMVLCFLCS
jgi:hypothetical protein